MMLVVVLVVKRYIKRSRGGVDDEGDEVDVV